MSNSLARLWLSALRQSLLFITFTYKATTDKAATVRRNHKMLLNADFTILIAAPLGFIAIILILGVEIFILNKFLGSKDSLIFLSIIISNSISALAGILFTFLTVTGYFIIVELNMYVDDNSNYFDINYNLKDYIFYSIAMFLVSFFIETVFHLVLLRNKFNYQNIIWGSLVANLISNLIGAYYIYLFVWHRN